MAVWRKCFPPQCVIIVTADCNKNWVASVNFFFLSFTEDLNAETSDRWRGNSWQRALFKEKQYPRVRTDGFFFLKISSAILSWWVVCELWTPQPFHFSHAKGNNLPAPRRRWRKKSEAFAQFMNTYSVHIPFVSQPIKTETRVRVRPGALCNTIWWLVLLH